MATLALHHPRTAADSHFLRQAGASLLSRSLLLGGFFAFWILVVIARLYYLQVIEYFDWVNRAQKQQQSTIYICPARGTIFDRNLRPLAMTVAAPSIFAVPSELDDPETTLAKIAAIVGLTPSEVKVLSARFSVYHSFCWVKRLVTDEQWAKVEALNLAGIHMQKEPKRYYPKHELAAQVLGYVGTGEDGLAGIEYLHDASIKGERGRMLLTRDARHKSFSSLVWPGKPGKNFVLTIDENIQYFAQKVLDDTVSEHQAAGGVAVVASPQTGEILAIANNPTLDANDYSRSPASNRIDQGVGWVYEPGSVFKLITVSSALEEKLTRPTEMIDCQWGKIVLGRHTIHDWKKFGVLSVADVIAHSSDVGSIKLGLRLGEDRFYRHIRDFGFGAKTDIELPGEERGLLRPPKRWSGISIGSISIGQEVGVTPVQLVAAYSAIANGGVWIQPRIIHDVFRDGVHDPHPPAAGHRVVSERTADEMKQMLAGVVDHGTGRLTKLDGYSSGGKSGTAQKIISGRYSATHYIASFVGFAPVERPVVTILVSIDSPVGAHHGGEVAGPAFKSIAEQTLRYLNVPQDNPSVTPQIASSKALGLPSRSPEAPEEAHPAAETTGSAVSPSGAPRADLAKQFGTGPLKPVALRDGSASDELLNEDDGSSEPIQSQVTTVVDQGPRVTVPNFIGMGVRSFAEKCAELGLEPGINGSGIGVEQDPAPGAAVPLRTMVQVRFTRQPGANAPVPSVAKR
jgi:cell division protein FtsI (penicillin-binding protein 3)